jgi:hypothetical protein
MPRYRFQVRRGKFSNGSSVEATLEGAGAAWKEAAGICADLARDIVSAEPEWLLEVTDEAGEPLFKFRFAAEALQRSVAADHHALSANSVDRLSILPMQAPN